MSDWEVCQEKEKGGFVCVCEGSKMLPMVYVCWLLLCSSVDSWVHSSLSWLTLSSLLTVVLYVKVGWE
ncbi:MAG: hypothetical protein JOS17DRAFT_507162 [Linnemannia elongata]|nr:MAG: hypothetical protein JOS17DRAFT_507162 [Linnemannia elongata]